MKSYSSFFELAQERYSARKYAPEQIAPEQLERILEAARIAPTAHNNQPFRIYVLQSEEAISKIREVTRYGFHAPTVLIITAVPDEAWVGEDGHNSGQVDVAIVTTQMIYAAWEQGIYSCWVRGFDQDKVAEVYGLPAGEEATAMLTMGYPQEKTHPLAGWHDVRKPIEELVRYL